MTTLSLREQRHQQAVADYAKMVDHRDVLLERLVRVLAKIKKQRTRIARLAKPVTVPRITLPLEALPPAPAPEPAPAPTPPIDDGIPDFLRRKQHDAVAREELLNEQAKVKRAKSLARIEKLKAKKAGELKRMPLEGKDALKAIFG